MTATYDVLLDADGDLPVFTRHVRGLDSISQRVRVRLATFAGEWFLDESKGLDWITWAQTKPFPAAQVSALIRGAIEEVPGVIRVTDSSYTYSGTAQSFEMTVFVETEAGTLSAVVLPFGGGDGNSAGFTATVSAR